MNVHKLNQLTQAQVGKWATLAQRQAVQGRVIDRIDRLSRANPQSFAVQIYNSAQTHSYGDIQHQFPLMSVIKPFLLLFCLVHHGDNAVLSWVGTQPSDRPFNSIEQLISDQGHPRNPMINSGAILLADKLPGSTAIDRCMRLCDWLNQQSGCRLSLDEAVLADVRCSDRSANYALLNALVKAGAIQNSELALDTYEQICCLSGQISDLAKLGLLLGIENLISTTYRQVINATMLTCGLYEASSDYAVKIGLPIKSGISGALLAVVPQQGAIACYSPTLDPRGNSVAGLAFVEAMAQELQLSVFI